MSFDLALRPHPRHTYLVLARHQGHAAPSNKSFELVGVLNASTPS